MLTRRYYDDTGMISHYQVLLPKQLLEEFLQSLHGMCAKHPGITKMIQEARQKYYYPALAEHIRQWVMGCEDCIKNKRIDNSQLKTPLLNCPDWDLGPEDALQMDVITKLATQWRLRKCNNCNGCVFSLSVCLPCPYRECSYCSKSNYGHNVQTHLFANYTNFGQRFLFRHPRY